MPTRLLAPALLAAAGLPLARQLAPAAAARALAAITTTAAAATVWALVVLAAGGLGRAGEVRACTHPSPAGLAATDPVPRALGVLAAILLACGMTRLARVLWRRHREVRALSGLRALPAAGALVVLADHLRTTLALADAATAFGRFLEVLHP